MSGIERRLNISDGPSGRKRIELDGIDISNVVRSYTIISDARDLPKVELDVLAVDLSVDGEPAEVYIPDETRDLLIRFGWTPPEGA